MLSRHKVFFLSILGLLFLCHPTFAIDLTIEVSELRNTDGSVFVFLWTPEDEGFPKAKKELGLEHRRVAATEPVVTFEDVPEGRYAISAIHFEGEDTEVPEPPKSGIPTVGIGLSNNPKIGLFNRPSFNKSAFELNQNTELEIKIRYFQ